MITLVLDEREVRALERACDFSRVAFEQAAVPVRPEENKLASAHLKVLSALERQERPSGFEALGVSEFERRTWDPRGTA